MWGFSDDVPTSGFQDQRERKLLTSIQERLQPAFGSSCVYLFKGLHLIVN